MYNINNLWIFMSQRSNKTFFLKEKRNKNSSSKCLNARKYCCLSHKNKKARSLFFFFISPARGTGYCFFNYFIILGKQNEWISLHKYLHLWFNLYLKFCSIYFEKRKRVAYLLCFTLVWKFCVFFCPHLFSSYQKIV